MEAPDSSGSLDLMANPGQMFEVFDKLPIELRLKIWKLRYVTFKNLSLLSYLSRSSKVYVYLLLVSEFPFVAK